MQSIVVTTREINEPDLAVQELVQQLKDFELKESSVGLLFCYSDAENGKIIAELQKQLSFDVLGCTAISTIDSVNGYATLAAVLLVLTADDCTFSTALSEPITPANAESAIQKTWEQAAAHLPASPRLAFALVPYQLDVVMDVYPETLNRIAPEVPVIGGVPSYNDGVDESLLFFREHLYPDRMALLLCSGNIRPVFSVQSINTRPIERKRVVTSAKGNTIYRVGDSTFTDYLEKLGLPVAKLATGNTTVAFSSNPLLLEHSPDSSDDFFFLRMLHKINLEEGSGTALNRIPEGSTISVCPLDRSEIASAATTASEQLIAGMEAICDNHKEYEFSTVLVVSCIGRLLMLIPKNSKEADGLLADLPADLSLAGFYSYGEIAPLSYTATDLPANNFAHNESLILCAF